MSIPIFNDNSFNSEFGAIKTVEAYMVFYPATSGQAQIVQSLFQESRYLHIASAMHIEEQLPSLIQAKHIWLAESQNDVWGMVIAQPKDCSAYPAETPEIIEIQTLALYQGRSPIQDIPQMIGWLTAHLRSIVSPYKLLLHSNQRWLKQPLHQAGFEIVERVQHLQLDGLSRRIGSIEPDPERKISDQSTKPHITFRPICRHDYASLAQLDAAIFDSIWHWSKVALENLARDHRIQVAVHNGTPVGYSAIQISREGQTAFAHLARLAVSPALRGQGIGQHLLMDVLQFAHVHSVENIGLNTQASNQAALNLYQRFGFRRTGQIDPVFVRKVINN